MPPHAQHGCRVPTNGGGATKITPQHPRRGRPVHAAEREDAAVAGEGLVTVTMEKCSDGWWRGSYTARVGWFSPNYVLEELDEAAGDAAWAQAQGPVPRSAMGRARALAGGADAVPFQLGHRGGAQSLSKGETMEGDREARERIPGGGAAATRVARSAWCPRTMWWC